MKTLLIFTVNFIVDDSSPFSFLNSIDFSFFKQVLNIFNSANLTYLLYGAAAIALILTALIVFIIIKFIKLLKKDKKAQEEEKVQAEDNTAPVAEPTEVADTSTVSSEAASVEKSEICDDFVKVKSSRQQIWKYPEVSREKPSWKD